MRRAEPFRQHGARHSARAPGAPARTLVIGCGFIGSHIVEELSTAPNRRPVVLTRTRPREPLAELIGEEGLHVGDACDPAALKTALDGVRHVVFAAGGPLPPFSERDPEPDPRLALDAIRSVLGALRDRPGVALTYLSSGGAVYGEPDRIPVDEDAPTRPLGAYGRQHLACEAEVTRARREDGLTARILRCSTVYGEHQRPDRGQGAIVTFLHRVAREEPVDLYGGGTTIRDYIYAGDVARIVVALLDRRDGAPIVNVGTGKAASLPDVLRLVEEQVGKPARVVTHPERRFDVHGIVLDTTRLRELVELTPTPLEAGIERTHRWLSTTSPEPA